MCGFLYIQSQTCSALYEFRRHTELRTVLETSKETGDFQEVAGTHGRHVRARLLRYQSLTTNLITYQPPRSNQRYFPSRAYNEQFGPARTSQGCEQHAGCGPLVVSSSLLRYNSTAVTAWLSVGFAGAEFFGRSLPACESVRDISPAIASSCP